MKSQKKIKNKFTYKISIIAVIIGILIFVLVSGVVIGISRIQSASQTQVYFEEWSSPTDNIVRSSPALGDIDNDGMLEVIVGCDDHNIYAFDGVRGDLIWNYSTGGAIESSPALNDIDGDTDLDVVVGSNDGYVYALEGENGNLLWSYSTGGAIESSPALGDIDGDTDLDVVVGSNNGYVYALEGENGNLLWNYSTGDAIKSSPALGDIDGDNNVDVVVGSNNGYVYALEGSNGSLLWDYFTSSSVYPPPTLGDIDGDNDVDVVVGSSNGYLYALGGDNGDLLWNYSTGSIIESKAVLSDIDGDNDLDIVFGSYDYKVYALDGPTGLQLWNYSTNGWVVASPLLDDVDGNKNLEVIIGSDDGNVYALKADNGRLLWSFSAGRSVRSSAALGDIDGDNGLEVVFGSFDNKVCAIEPMVGPRSYMYIGLFIGIGHIIVLFFLGILMLILLLLMYYRTAKKKEFVFQQPSLKHGIDTKEKKALSLRNFENKKYNIKTNDLTKIYRTRLTRERIVAVDGINLLVKNGVHGFLGPNGAGKTSTIKMLIGAISITNGSAKIKGYNAGSVKAKGLIGYMPQQIFFYDKMSGREYLIHTAKLAGIKTNKAFVLAEEFLDRFNLTEVGGRQISKYSGGMKQKLGLAAAFISSPEILILDEPTSDLDPVGRDTIVSYIKELSKETSIFVSSHILPEVEEMCDTLTIIRDGKIVLTDTIENLKQLYKDGTYRFIINTNNNNKLLSLLKKKSFIEQVKIDPTTNMIYAISSSESEMEQFINQCILEHDISLKKYTQKEASLKDIFLQLVNKKEKST